ncbi:MAG: sugar kinase [Acidobacteriota bacterium]|nr:sugar kinase [Acidobacteriota bacterium]
MSLLAVGSVAFDDLKTPGGSRDNLMGGSATYFTLSASHFVPTQLVAVVGMDFMPEHRAVFQGRPIDLEGLEQKQGLSFRWKGSYGDELNDATTLDTQLNVFADFHPRLPETFRESPYLFLGNIEPSLQLDVVHQMARRPRWVALDTMNYWILGSRRELADTLKEVDILLVNEMEVRELTSEHNLMKAYRQVLKFGPKVLVIKRGEYGSVLMTEDSVFSAPAYPLEDIVDPTGAGDTFAGGFLGKLAQLGRMDLPALKNAVITGTVMASFTVEQFGIGRLETVQKKDLADRSKAFSDMIRLDDL